MNLSNNILPSPVSLFIIALQIHATFSISNSHIRFGLSDVMMPFLLLFFISTRGVRLAWSFRWLPLWLIIFSVWLGICLLNGFLETGHLSNWAFVNKFIGWFVLLGYLCLGNYLSDFRDPKFLENSILKPLFISSACISLFSLFMAVLFDLGFRPPVGVNDISRFIGFLENPNAYGLFSVFVVLLQIPFIKSKTLFPRHVHGLLFLFNSISVVCSGSRTAWVTLLIGLLVFLYFKVVTFQKLFLFSICLVLSLFLLNLGQNSNYLSNKKNYFLEDSGSVERVESTKQALSYWQEKPLVGIGLGQYLVKQPITIHNTFLWLLTETGLIGVLLFAVFALKSVQIIFQKSYSVSEYISKEELEGLLAKGLFAVMLGFFVASLATEVLYQRYLWFFLGMMLCSNKAPRFVAG